VQPIIIVGNAGLARILLEYVRRDSRYRPVAFAVDRPFITDTSIEGLPVCDLADVARQFPPSQHGIFLAVGYSNLLRNRAAMFERMHQMGYDVLSYVHPDARVYSEQIGKGAWIMPNAVVDVFAQVGDNSVVWANCTVAHNAVVRENCWLASGCVISADAMLGRNTFVGVNASVVNGVQVGSHNIVGANALVAKNTGELEVTLCGQHGKYRLNSEEFIKLVRM
jgi:sugar O-acyltransferase (sialic acid O-acetyltransferase NeuD family)